MSTLAPLTPLDSDLQDFPFMPLHVARLRDSDLAAEEEPEACWYAVLLWAASWHQLPAGSLPDNDVVLRRLAGLGRDAKRWAKFRDGALRGFILCSDGRFYHPVVAEQVKNAWNGKLRQLHRNFCAAIRKHNERNPDEKRESPSFEDWDALGRPDRVTQPRHALVTGTEPNVTRDITQSHTPVACDMPSNRDRDREGHGYGEGHRDSNNNDCLIDARARTENLDEEEGAEEAPLDPADAALIRIASAAGFELTDANREAQLDIVRGWLDADIAESTIVSAIMEALPALKGPTSSLSRFSRAVRHAHAQSIAKVESAIAAKPTLIFDIESEDISMSGVRRSLADALGERVYASFQSAFTLQPNTVGDKCVLQIKDRGFLRIYDDARVPIINRVAREHGFAEVWA